MALAIAPGLAATAHAAAGHGHAQANTSVIDRELRDYFAVATVASGAAARSTLDPAGTEATNDVDEVFWDGMEACGDGAIDGAGEECDRNDFGGSTCLSYGFTAGSLVCDRTCHIDASQCTGACPVLCGSDTDCGVCGPCFAGVCIY